MAKKNKNLNQQPQQTDNHDWYDDYKEGFNASKEKRRFIDVLYSVFLIIFGFILMYLGLKI